MRWRFKSPASRLITQLFIQRGHQRKHQSSASLAFARGIHRWPVDSPHKVPVTRKMFPLDEVITKGSGQSGITPGCTENTYFLWLGYNENQTCLYGYLRGSNIFVNERRRCPRNVLSHWMSSSSLVWYKVLPSNNRYIFRHILIYVFGLRP